MSIYLFLWNIKSYSHNCKPITTVTMLILSSTFSKPGNMYTSPFDNYYSRKVFFLKNIYYVFIYAFNLIKQYILNDFPKCLSSLLQTVFQNILKFLKNLSHFQVKILNHLFHFLICYNDLIFCLELTSEFYLFCFYSQAFLISR